MTTSNSNHKAKMNLTTLTITGTVASTVKIIRDTTHQRTIIHKINTNRKSMTMPTTREWKRSEETENMLHI